MSVTIFPPRKSYFLFLTNTSKYNASASTRSPHSAVMLKSCLQLQGLPIFIFFIKCNSVPHSDSITGRSKLYSTIILPRSSGLWAEKTRGYKYRLECLQQSKYSAGFMTSHKIKWLFFCIA